MPSAPDSNFLCKYTHAHTPPNPHVIKQQSRESARTSNHEMSAPEGRDSRACIGVLALSYQPQEHRWCRALAAPAGRYFTAAERWA